MSDTLDPANESASAPEALDVSKNSPSESVPPLENLDESKNPWTKLSGAKVYDNAWIQVEEHQVLTPSGSNGIYGKVHFKNLAIGIIPLDADDFTWLVGQYRYTLDAYSWEIPMGGGSLDVDPIESAKRELREETGLIANQWTKLQTLHTSNCVTDEIGYIYVAEGLTQGPTERDETEQLQLKKLPIQEAVAMAMNGDITDAISVAALLKFALERQWKFSDR